MIEELLEQVNAAVDRFVAKNPSLRNDRDDLVQDVFLKILPRLNGGSYSLSQCRAFTHRATFWVCRTALKAEYTANTAKRAKNLRLSDFAVYNIDWDVVATSVSIVAGLPDRVVIDWDRVEAIAKENAALFTWYAIEPDAEVSKNLWDQIIEKFEFVIS